MTTFWNPAGIWAGQTVAVLGNAPNLRAHLKQLPPDCKMIAASRAINVHPQADMMCAIDGNVGPDEFTGMYVVSTPSDGPGLYVGMWYERAELAPGHIIEFRNSGLLAIRVAALTGASRIILAGFDTDLYEKRYDYAYPGITIAFNVLLGELRARGIEVQHLVDVQPDAPKPKKSGVAHQPQTDTPS